MEACVAMVVSLVENKEFEIVDKPASKPVTISKWVFKNKKGLFGNIEKYKARQEARGFTEE